MSTVVLKCRTRYRTDGQSGDCTKLKNPGNVFHIQIIHCKTSNLERVSLYYRNSVKLSCKITLKSIPWTIGSLRRGSKSSWQASTNSESGTLTFVHVPPNHVKDVQFGRLYSSTYQLSVVWGRAQVQDQYYMVDLLQTPAHLPSVNIRT